MFSRLQWLAILATAAAQNGALKIKSTQGVETNLNLDSRCSDFATVQWAANKCAGAQATFTVGGYTSVTLEIYDQAGCQGDAARFSYSNLNGIQLKDFDVTDEFADLEAKSAKIVAIAMV